jgi:hypothetical protein
MEETPPVKYRVVGIREDGEHVALCSYLPLEAAEATATLAQSQRTFTKIVIESDEVNVRRAQI